MGAGNVPHIHLACVRLRQADENDWALGHYSVDNEHRNDHDKDRAERQAKVTLVPLDIPKRMLYEE